MAELLGGVRVLELSGGIQGGFCAKLFADCGAEVIKVTLPGDTSETTDHVWLDPGKSNVVLDWRVGEGSRLLTRLAGTADVLIRDEASCFHDRSPEEWAQLPSRLVVVNLTSLGVTGPFAGTPATDLTVSALSGMARINGTANETPLREPGSQTSIVGAFAGFIGALTALANRSQTGRGQTVQSSALEAMVNVLSPSVLQCSYQEGGPARRPSAEGFLFDCSDGKVSIIVSSERSWETMVELWALEIAPDDPKLGSEGVRRVNMPAVRQLLEPVLRGKTRREVFEELCSVRVPCGMLMEPWELPEDPHLRERRSFQSIQQRDGAPTRTLPGPSFRVAGSLPRSVASVARPGEDTSRILAPLAHREAVVQ